MCKCKPLCNLYFDQFNCIYLCKLRQNAISCICTYIIQLFNDAPSLILLIQSYLVEQDGALVCFCLYGTSRLVCLIDEAHMWAPYGWDGRVSWSHATVSAWWPGDRGTIGSAPTLLPRRARVDSTKLITMVTPGRQTSKQKATDTQTGGEVGVGFQLWKKRW